MVQASEATLKAMREKVLTKSDPQAQVGGEGQKDDVGALVVLSLSVKMPGRIVASRAGIVDDISDTVTWSLYHLAAAFGDVALTASCELPKSARP